MRDPGLDARAKVKAQGKPDFAAATFAFGRNQEILAAQFAAIITQTDYPAVDQAKAADIAIVAGLKPGRPRTARTGDHPPGNLHCIDPGTQLAVDQNGGGIGIVEHQSSMGRCCPQTGLKPLRDKPTRRRRAAAIHKDPLIGMAEFKGKGRSTASTGMARHWGRGSIKQQQRILRGHPLIAPLANL